MPPPRTGSVETCRRKDGSRYFRARIRLADGSRARVDVPKKYATDEAAELYAQAAQEREDERGDLLAAKKKRKAEAAKRRDPSRGETCTKYRERLDSHRKALGRRGGRDDASTWKVWLADRIGHLPIAKVTRDDVEVVRDALDEAIALHKRTEGKEGSPGPKRAANVWSSSLRPSRPRAWRSGGTSACAKTTRAPACSRPSVGTLVGGPSCIPWRPPLCWPAATCRCRGRRPTPSLATSTFALAS